MPDASSLLPTLVAIVLAVWTRQVHLSLFAGVWLGASLLEDHDPFAGLVRAIDACIRVFADPSNARVIVFSALVGSVIALTRHSGGIEAFVGRLTDSGWVRTRRRAMLLSWMIGFVIFIESSLTSLINGAICRPIFAKFKISREKLAYLCDATSAPVCVLLPLNGWAVYVLGLLEAEKVEAPLEVFIQSIPLNFYALFAVLLPLGLIFSGWDFGPMKRAEARARTEVPTEAAARPAGEHAGVTAVPGRGRAVDFILPIATMVVVLFVGLWVTGKGNILEGSGSTSVLWAVLSACVVAGVLLVVKRKSNISQTMEITFQGIGDLMPLAILLVLAFAIGQITRDLGTGRYLAGFVTENLASETVPAVIFCIACVIAFSTGTSWGTFALMVPIGLPLVAASPGMTPVALAAVLGGGVFGDHCSPISDTTMISSLAADCDHIEHVRTQLPYALVGGLVSILGLLLVGFLWA